jgi:hypothetical protein
LRLLVRKSLWGEERVTLELPDGTYRSLPIGWTDAVAPDPYLSVAGGRSLFRVHDLLELAALLAGGRG